MTLEETSTHAPRQYLKPAWIRHKSDMPAERQAYQHVGGNIYSVRPELQHARFQTMAELAPTASRETHRRYHPYYADSAARRRSRRGRSRSRT